MSGNFTPRDVKPVTPIESLSFDPGLNSAFDPQLVSSVTGFSQSFIRKVCGAKKRLESADVLLLLNQDSFVETFVPRSRVLSFLESHKEVTANRFLEPGMHVGSALSLVPFLEPHSIQSVVTSTPYWAMRIYDDMVSEHWADGEICPFGMEQTPEGFIRHSVEVLWRLKPKLRLDGSIWWNVGDTYNTRTQIRSNAAEALRAMQGRDKKSWHDHDMRRYSAGHAYLEDGEQTLIPSRIAERASRIGYLVKSMVTWVKPSTTPEPQNSRVSRTTEQIIHLALQRTPKFNKSAYLQLPSHLGGRSSSESARLSDAWILNTSVGSGGHGAQFPLSLPGRCISISSAEGDLILDPFIGSGTTAVVAKELGRNWIGFDTSPKYAEITESRVAAVKSN